MEEGGLPLFALALSWALFLIRAPKVLLFDIDPGCFLFKDPLLVGVLWIGLPGDYCGLKKCSLCCGSFRSTPDVLL